APSSTLSLSLTGLLFSPRSNFQVTSEAVFSCHSFPFLSLLQDLARLLLLKFVSELMAARVDQMLPVLEEEEVGVREEVMRRHLPLSQRERKAGCRNFFWKTFTSC
uniref:Somatostatin/Cortistatin C-terminal domain-containing protein n=1 Tax=Lates calcarifer TaxID=8187 RepID=A0A4W6D305_LATCA